MGRIFNILGLGITNPRLTGFEKYITAEDSGRIADYSKYWEFFLGDHFSRIEMDNKPEVVQNWCRKLVNLYTAIEVNPGMSFKFNKDVENIALPFLNGVWEDNNIGSLHSDGTQMKNVSGDSYYLVEFVRPGDTGFYDPFDEYPDGRIAISSIPSNICFPIFKPGYNDEMESCTIVFPMDVVTGFGQTKTRFIRIVYKPDTIESYSDGVMDEGYPVKNPYGVIPIVHIKNMPHSGKHYGFSDLVDIVPLNAELNLKNSDISEILEYHAAPVTLIFGARTGQLERGANKVWSGLPKDGKVQNLELDSDMTSSTEYRDSFKNAIHEIGNAPKIAVGSQDLPANISGTALGTAFLPINLCLGQKRLQTSKGFKLLNKILLKIGLIEKLIEKPNSITSKDFYSHSIIFGDYLPKDALIELQELQAEIKAGLESRRGAMKRLKRENIESLITEIDKERKDDPTLCGITPISLAANQILVNPDTGETIAKNIQEVDQETQEGKSSTNGGIAVGKNANNQDIKINSGLTNTNPGKTTK